ncbi:hypothetical protein HPB50_024139 [Hyalomma asiaticum]|uniref:Uncharacterized protein n=1 Tax=Hyalomma asiaticum TaxID=266040 RepID=A0ACB7TQK0_HYAAI|nr:hypothetical protein HPB50_024139 [Hyalomma asiaticum]
MDNIGLPVYMRSARGFRGAQFGTRDPAAHRVNQRARSCGAAGVPARTRCVTDTRAQLLLYSRKRRGDRSRGEESPMPETPCVPRRSGYLPMSLAFGDARQFVACTEEVIFLWRIRSSGDLDSRGRVSVNA